MTPHAFQIPHFNAYAVRLDQYGTIDVTLNPTAAEGNNVGYTGLLVL